jgi:hypothetical protein
MTPQNCFGALLGTGHPAADATEVQRRLAAVFAADEDGYSRFMGAQVAQAVTVTVRDDAWGKRAQLELEERAAWADQ